jgi:rare lipoprotein A
VAVVAAVVIALAVIGAARPAGGEIVLFEAPPPRPAPAAPPELVVKVETGKAIWYGGRWHGRKTASGEPFDKEAMTAAHRSLPLGSRVRVINLLNQRAVVVRINDRGPYGRDRSRIIDVSEAAARQLGFHARGWTEIRLEVLGASDAPAPR